MARIVVVGPCPFYIVAAMQVVEEKKKDTHARMYFV